MVRVEQDPYSDVELSLVDQQRPFDILLYYESVVLNLVCARSFFLCLVRRLLYLLRLEAWVHLSIAVWDLIYTIGCSLVHLLFVAFRLLCLLSRLLLLDVHLLFP